MGIAVSVIVPVRDDAAGARGLLASLDRQTLARDRFEVVVGDDGSSDAPRSLASDDGRVHVTSAPRANSYAARNRAAHLARAPLLAFCDADCRPEPDWLEAGLRALEGADLVAGLVRFTVPRRRTVWSLLDLDMNLDQERSVRAGRAATANLFVRRELFERLHGFDDTLPNTSDYDFVARAIAGGSRLAYEPLAIVRHPTRDDASGLLRKLWAVNRRYANREARAGRVPVGLRGREWVPVVQTLRSRRRFGRSLRIDRKRLVECGVAPTAWEDARALPLLYLVLPYVRSTAQLRGWWEGRRLA